MFRILFILLLLAAVPVSVSADTAVDPDDRVLTLCPCPDNSPEGAPCYNYVMGEINPALVCNSSLDCGVMGVVCIPDAAVNP